MEFNKQEFIKNKINQNYKNKFIQQKQVQKYRQLVKLSQIDKIINNLSIRFNRTCPIQIKMTHMQILGCSKEELQFHLQQQFKENMNFDNYGYWEVDHIFPISKFNLQDIQQILICYNYKNLQPLWKNENRIKSNKI